MDTPFADDPPADAAALRTLLEDAVSWPLPEVTRQDLDVYVSALDGWAPRLDLIAPRSRAELWDLPLADAAVLAREEAVMGTGAIRVVDVGSGGGAPGIPLAILLAALGRPCHMTLVEPRAKRVTFLRSVAAQIRSASIEVVRGRSDSLPAHAFDVAVSRATFVPEEWLVEGTRLARDALWLLLARAELPPLAEQRVTRDVGYCWPLTEATRRAVRCRTLWDSSLHP
jgi:16S rRNA (guanine527-N7)-methyltransferase